MTLFRRAFKMKLLTGVPDEYRKRHDEIWPELATLLSNKGITDYSIFLDETDNTLFGVLKYESEEALSSLPQQRIMKEWWCYMADLMETNPDNSPIEVPLKEIFHLP